MNGNTTLEEGFKVKEGSKKVCLLIFKKILLQYIFFKLNMMEKWERKMSKIIL